MILAAGLGLRMRPITLTTPKPLIKVGGQTIIDQALDRLQETGINRVIVNTYWLGEKVERHLKKRKSPEISFSVESELLETGGGVAKALPLLGEEPFFIINGDTVWRNGIEDVLYRLAMAWESDLMDALLLVMPTVRAPSYNGAGDFLMDQFGRLIRRPERTVSPFVYTGIQLVHPRLFKNAPCEPFSINILYDRVITKARLFGIVHDGEWYHLGTPAALEQAEAELLQKEGARARILI